MIHPWHKRGICIPCTLRASVRVVLIKIFVLRIIVVNRRSKTVTIVCTNFTFGQTTNHRIVLFAMPYVLIAPYHVTNMLWMIQQICVNCFFCAPQENFLGFIKTELQQTPHFSTTPLLHRLASTYYPLSRNCLTHWKVIRDRQEVFCVDLVVVVQNMFT